MGRKNIFWKHFIPYKNTVDCKISQVIKTVDLFQKSASTEELTAEMANLDCLMKDLNAITQQDFQC